MTTAAYGLTMGPALVAILLGGWSCGAREAVPGVAEFQPMPESIVARTRVKEVRAHFLLPTAPPVATEPSPALGAGVAIGFELRDGYVHAVVPSEARQAANRTASVRIPLHAYDPVRLEDDTSHVAVSFALRGANDATVTASDGILLYPAALAEADVFHRVHAEGTEDYVVFEHRPAKEEIAYDVDVSRVAGLRLVGNTLEFLDEEGVPRLRVARPYVVDVRGARTDGVLAVEGCALDASPRAPWGRTVEGRTPKADPLAKRYPRIPRARRLSQAVGYVTSCRPD